MSETCRNCKGTGEAECWRCGGTGKLTSSHGITAGVYTCLVCHGTKHATCPGCEGTGVIPEPNGPPCPKCGKKTRALNPKAPIERRNHICDLCSFLVYAQAQAAAAERERVLVEAADKVSNLLYGTDMIAEGYKRFPGHYEKALNEIQGNIAKARSILHAAVEQAGNLSKSSNSSSGPEIPEK